MHINTRYAETEQEIHREKTKKIAKLMKDTVPEMNGIGKTTENPKDKIESIYDKQVNFHLLRTIRDQ